MGKTRIYKTVVKSVIADATKTLQMSTVEMSNVRAIQGETPKDKIRNKNLRERCNMLNISKYV